MYRLGEHRSVRVPRVPWAVGAARARVRVAAAHRAVAAVSGARAARTRRARRGIPVAVDGLPLGRGHSSRGGRGRARRPARRRRRRVRAGDARPRHDGRAAHGLAASAARGGRPRAHEPRRAPRGARARAGRPGRPVGRGARRGPRHHPHVDPRRPDAREPPPARRPSSRACSTSARWASATPRATCASRGTCCRPDAREVFRREVGADDATWARARGWVLLQALAQLAYFGVATRRWPRTRGT